MSVLEDSEEESEGKKNEIAYDYECFKSESETIRQEYSRILTLMNPEALDQEDQHGEQIKFLFEVKMICSIDGSLNSSERIQSLTNNTQKNPSLFQVTQKPFFYNMRPFVLMIIKDVTHFNQIRVLQSINQNKSQMLSQVTHEFRTPLNCIILLVQTLMEQSQEDIKKEQADFLNPIFSSAKQLLSLINDLLDLAQLKAGKFKLVFEEFDIRQLIQDLYTLLLPNVSSKNNTLTIEIKTTSHKLISDANRIRQILLNLVSNANKYTSQGKISISATQINPNCIELAVQDTGFGIEKEDQQKLFQAFGKLERGKELNTQGVGLGLMISNILAERLAETDEFFNNSSDNELQPGLKVFSEGQNKGSRFSFIVVDQKDLNLSSKYYQGSRNGGSERMNSMAKRKHRNTEEPQQRKISLNQARQEEQQNFSPPLHMKSVVFEKPFPHICKESLECIIDNSEISPKPGVFDCSCPEILIVDDEIFNIIALKQAVKKYNFKIDTAENGMVALEKVRKFLNCDDCVKHCINYKIILMDMEMPIMNGLDTVKKIRELPNTQDIYIIGCSGHGGSAIQSCLEAGMNDYLQKPLKLSKFIEIVGSITHVGNV